MELRIKNAESESERLAADRITWHAFGRTGLPWPIHAARRLNSGRWPRATPWIGTVDGETVTSLLCYQFDFQRGDERRAGFGLGAVGTHPDHRRRGHAARLCAAVAEHDGGAGLLFAGIDPEYYERLGYVAVPAWDHHCARASDLAASGPRAALRPIEARRELDRLQEAWSAAHDGWYIPRDEERWHASFEINPQDFWFAVEAGGYVRCVLEEDALDIVERCTPDPDGALRAVAALAGDRKLTTWLEPDALIAEWFEDIGRATTLPMLRGLDAPESVRISSADYF
ncbi:MAG: GNAT family N-acetyltransferase [Planctomycetota bacterium]